MRHEIRPGGDLERTWWRLGFAAVVALAGILYLPSLGQTAIWEDPDLLNGSGINGGGVTECFTRPFLGFYFRPLTALSFLAQHAVAGSSPFSYHLTNIVLHMLATGVLILLLSA